MKNGAGNLYYIYYRTGTPIFTNEEEEYYEICCFKRKKIDNKIVKQYNKKDENEIIKKFEINKEKLNRKCELYRNFEQLNYRVNNKELLGIGTNLVNLKLIDYDEEGKKHEKIGGIHFLDLIDSHLKSFGYNNDVLNTWKYNIKYIENNNYSPSRCEYFCPYYKECNTAGNILDTLKISNNNRIIKNEKEIKFEDLNIIREKLKNTIEEYAKECLNNKIDAKMLKLIKAQTGIGKTTATVELLKKYQNTNKRIIYATTTIDAKREFDKLLTKNNIRHICTPDFKEIANEDLQSKIEHNQKLGMYNTLKNFLRNCIEDEEISIRDKEIIENHINFKEKSKEYNIIVSTHKMLQYIGYIPADLVIIDEDYIEKSGYNVGKVSFGKLNSIIEKTKTTGLLINKKINQIKEIGYKTLGDIKPIKIGKEKKKQIEDECSNIETNFSIISFLESNLVYYYNERENENPEINSETSLNFMKANDLPKSNIIILSATIDREMYERKFGDTLNISYTELPKAKYFGKIYQFSKLSYSKSCIDSHEGILDEIKNNYQNIPIITYKKYCSKENEYNFGAINGLNSLQRKDLLIVGSYKRNNLYYLTLAYDIYGKKYNEAEIELDNIEIEREDVSFKFYTFKDEILRKIELWSIYSELEQSVGRARLVNPENKDTKVYVYSGFPAEQAKLCTELPEIIETEYTILEDQEAV